MNVSSKIYGVYECDIVTALNTYDFVIKDFVIKKGGHYLCQTLYIQKLIIKSYLHIKMNSINMGVIFINYQLKQMLFLVPPNNEK